MKVVNIVSAERLHTFRVAKSRRYEVLDGKMMKTEEMIIVPRLPSNTKHNRKISMSKVYLNETSVNLVFRKRV